MIIKMQAQPFTSQMKTSLAFSVILLWVIMPITLFSPLAFGNGCSKEQRRALMEIRNSSNGFAFAGWDGRDCCEAGGIYCFGRNGGVSTIRLGDSNELAPSNTWYPNATLFALFDELELLMLDNMKIGGSLQCENSYSIYK